MGREVVVVLAREEAEVLLDILKHFYEDHEASIEDFPDQWQDEVHVMNKVITQIEKQLSGEVKAEVETVIKVKIRKEEGEEHGD